jgi:CRISPR-associated protein Cas2
MFWIVSYDIPNDRRRRKVSKVLEGFGRRVQYSVFECELNAEKAEKLEKQLSLHIDRDEDDIRLYPLDRQTLSFVRLLGRAQLQRERSYYMI